MRGLKCLFSLVLVLSVAGGALAIDLIPKLDAIITSLTSTGISQIPLNMNSDMIKLNGSIDDLIVGLGAHTIGYADASILLKVNVNDFIMNNLNIGGTYDIYGILGDNAMTIFGKGDVQITLDKLNLISLYIDIGSREYEEGGVKYAFIRELTLDLSLENFSINLENLLGGGQLGDLMNEVLSEFVTTIANIPEYRDELIKLLVNLVNEMLIGTTLADLLALITGRRDGIEANLV